MEDRGKLYSPKTINHIKERYGFKLSKSLGQNFLTDKNIIDKIIESSEVTSKDTVIEIGPGIGVITAEAAKLARDVIAIEIDKNLIPILNETLGEYDNVHVINQDVLKTDVNEIIKEYKCENVKIISNLPYYITTPILMYLLENQVNAESITVMMQKEVGDRIKAKEGTKAYGAISVAIQYYCYVETVVSVPKTIFVPPPKVDSVVLKLTRRKEPPVQLIDSKMFFKTVGAGFGQRRKTLLNSLSSMDSVSKDTVKSCLNDLNIDEKRRAETLSIDEFAAIANYLTKALEV